MFGKYQDITGQLNFYLFLLLAICLPFSYDLVRVMWTVWLISYIIEFPFLTTNEEGKIVFALSKSNFLRLDNIPLYAACLFVVWEAVSLLWTGADSYGFRAQHVTLLLLPIAAVCGFNKYYKWKTVARTLVVACVVSFFVYCFCFYWLQNINYLLTPFFEGTLEPFRFESFVRFGQIKHHTFYCIIMLIAMVLCFFLFDDSCKRYGKPKAVIIFIVCQTVLLTAIIATMSRVALLLLPLLVVVGLIQNLRGRHRWIAIGGSAIVAIAVALAVVLLHPRFEGFSLEQITQTEQHLHDEQTEPRLKIWSLALETPSDYLPHGMGAGSATGAGAGSTTGAGAGSTTGAGAGGGTGMGCLSDATGGGATGGAGGIMRAHTSGTLRAGSQSGISSFHTRVSPVTPAATSCSRETGPFASAPSSA